MSKIIDISEHNGNVDFALVKADSSVNVKGVIIRIGYRGYTQGTLKTDTMFKHNISQAVSCGFHQLGFYWFTQATSETEAVEEAEYAYKLASGYVENPLIYLDSEYANGSHNGRADKLGKEKRTEYAAAFCHKVKKLGGRAGVYASDSWFEEHLSLEELEKYSLWVARYSSHKPEYVKNYDGWQYSSGCKVDGITCPKEGSDISNFSKKLSEIE